MGAAASRGLQAAVCAPATTVACRRPGMTAGARKYGLMALFHRNIEWLPEVAGKDHPIAFSNRYISTR
jgi:hypothetical protein